MANFIYGKAKESLLKGEINLLANQIKALMIDTSLYSPSQNADQFVSDIPTAAIKFDTTALQSVSITLGVIDAEDLLVPNYPGNAFGALVLFQVGSSNTNSRLLFYIDTAVGLPFTGSISTSPVTIIWDNGPNKIIAL